MLLALVNMVAPGLRFLFDGAWFSPPWSPSPSTTR
jgi:hypothetical protein